MCSTSHFASKNLIDRNQGDVQFCIPVSAETSWTTSWHGVPGVLILSLITSLVLGIFTSMINEIKELD